MQARHASDPTSWEFQAAIHGALSTTACGAESMRARDVVFVSWYRMFLYYFGRMVRAAVIEVGSPEDRASSYWNYELGGTSAALPAAFRSPTTGGAHNLLYATQRAPEINAGHALAAQSSSPEARLRPAFIVKAEFGGGRTQVPFQHFNGLTGKLNLEAQPHDAMDGVIGGARGWMNEPDQTPRRIRSFRCITATSIVSGRSGPAKATRTPAIRAGYQPFCTERPFAPCCAIRWERASRHCLLSSSSSWS
jgi:tyrosinase